MSNIEIPLLRPKLPDADALVPYLRRIDSRQHYTNFGGLQDEFLGLLVEHQQVLDGCPVHGVLTTSGTLGLELVLSALDLPLGSRVAVPALTFPATATAVERCGHVPVLLDVDPDTWLLTPAHMPADLSGLDIQAVIPVATFGLPQNLQAWSAWREATGIHVIIDAAAALGSQKTMADIPVVFSLHATKTLSSGEGGLVLTQDRRLAERLKAMTNFGIGLNMPTIATNAKMSEYHAAVGLAHLEIWPAQVAARKALLGQYRQALAGAEGSVFKFQNGTGLFAPSVFCIQLASPALRDQLERLCEREGIQTRRWYLPLLQHQSMLKWSQVPSPTVNAEYLADTLLGLPFFPDMTDAQCLRVARTVLALNAP